MMTLPGALTGDATAGFAVDWTGRFRGRTPATVRPQNTAEVAAVLALCTDAGLPVVPQGGNTGLVGGGVPLHGLIMADVEFSTDNEAQSFLPPAAAVAEVTDDPRFTGGSLVSARRHDLLAWLAEYGIELQQTE